jgi:hypothetical protein
MTQRVLGLCSFSSALAFGVVMADDLPNLFENAKKVAALKAKAKLKCSYCSGKLVFEFDDKDRLNRVHQMKEVAITFWTQASAPRLGSMLRYTQML